MEAFSWTWAPSLSASDVLYLIGSLIAPIPVRAFVVNHIRWVKGERSEGQQFILMDIIHRTIYMQFAFAVKRQNAVGCLYSSLSAALIVTSPPPLNPLPGSGLCHWNSAQEAPSSMLSQCIKWVWRVLLCLCPVKPLISVYLPFCWSLERVRVTHAYPSMPPTTIISSGRCRNITPSLALVAVKTGIVVGGGEGKGDTDVE